MFRAFHLAWLSLVRQPARALLGVAGIAAIGALLFDMLLLSRGLVLSFDDLLEQSGFDIRILASDAPPFTGPRLTGAEGLARAVGAVSAVEAVLPLRVRDAAIVNEAAASQPPLPPRTGGDEQRSGDAAAESNNRIHFIGADPRVRSMWTIVEGEDLPDSITSQPAIVINRRLASRLDLQVRSRLVLEGRCRGSSDVVTPVSFTVVGVAEFPFDSVTASTVAGTLRDVDRLCGDQADDSAEMFMVRSRPEAGASAAAAAIRAAHPDLHVVTNEELVERFGRVEFSYFRQISTVLAVVTLFFGFLLIAVLLTVSVNQRLGEIAALRAVGLSRGRVIAGVLWESVMLVGSGGILALPLGFLLSLWLDTILRRLPGLPAGLHFFVFEPRALVLYLVLLVVAALAAALYPMRVVSLLPIAATLRREVVS